MRDGGYIVPEAIAQDLIDNASKSMDELMISLGFDPHAPRKPLTLRQRVRLWRSRVYWTIHDRLFPDCDGER
jgi:hypothetical protein